MSHIESEIIIRNIFREIAQKCTAKGQAVTETLVAFMVKAVVLDPRNGFSVDRKLTEQDVQKLEKMCIERLVEECSPSLDTIKMQVYFNMNYPSRREFMEENQRTLQSKLSSLSREITDSRARTRQELEEAYSKITAYVLLRSEMGSTTDISTVREATAALQSVFPRTDLATFLSLMRKDKEEQLSELTLTVTGIRLFNKFRKREAEDIDLKDLLSTFINPVPPATTRGIEGELSAARNLAWKYTALLEKLADVNVESTGRDIPLALLKQALYNVRQHEDLLKVVLADSSFCTRQVEILLAEFIEQLRLLKEMMQSSKMAIPTAKVFPLFQALSKLRSALRDETALLNLLVDAVVNLRPFLASQSKIFPEASLDALLDGCEVKTDQERMEEAAGGRVNAAKMAAQEWIFPEITTSFHDVPLQYNGLCGYALVKKDGLLLPGNPSIGILKHKGKFYVFSSKEAAVTFASRVEESVAEVEETTKLSPELIQLLKLHHNFSRVTPYAEMQSGERLLVKPRTKCESGTQTDIHPVETNIDRSYEWNEWELRRKAIKLANLRTKLTHSTQTDMSHMRRETSTQVYLPKEAACQSRRDGHTAMARPVVYLAGLRGQRSGRVIKTDLTAGMDGQ